jgi:hypothetical protein
MRGITASAADPHHRHRPILGLHHDRLPLDVGTEHFGIEHPALGCALGGDLDEAAGQQDHGSDWESLTRALREPIAEPTARAFAFVPPARPISLFYHGDPNNQFDLSRLAANPERTACR